MQKVRTFCCASRLLPISTLAQVSPWSPDRYIPLPSVPANKKPPKEIRFRISEPTGSPAAAVVQLVPPFVLLYIPAESVGVPAKRLLTSHNNARMYHWPR